MSGGFANMNGGGFGAKPRALMCYICGREYGTASLQIHLKTCMKKWEIEENKKPKRERRPMPQPPQQLSNVLDRLGAGEQVNMDELEVYNNKANDEYNDKALIRCDYCNRTFLPERLGIHRKICTPEKPFKPLPPPTGKKEPQQLQQPTANARSSSISKGGMPGSKKAPTYEEEDEYPTNSKPSYGGSVNPKATPTKPMTKQPGAMGGSKPQAKPQPQYDQEEDEYEEEPQQVAPPKKSAPMKKAGGYQAAAQSYGAPSEYADVNLVECDLCERKFAADRLDRHMKACTKIQKSDAKHAKKVALAQKKQLETEKFIAKEAKYKKSSWRDQHNDFMESMKYNRKMKKVEQEGGDVRTLGPPPKSSAVESSYIECPYCNRKFNQQAGERHIASCKNVINKPKPVGSYTASKMAAANNYGSPSKPNAYGTPNSKISTSTASSYGSPNTIGKKATMGTASYRGGSYGGNEDYEESYNASNYGANGMGQSRQGFGVGGSKLGSPPMNTTKGGGFGMNSTKTGGFGSPGMNNTKGGGFGMKSPERTSTSSLANAGKMSMQADYRYNGATGKSGYKY